MTGRAGTDILIRPFLQVLNGIHHAAAKLSIPRPGAVKAVLFHRSRREAKETRSLGRTQISEWWSFRSHRKHPSDKRRIGAPDSTHVHSRHIPMAAQRLDTDIQEGREERCKRPFEFGIAIRTMDAVVEFYPVGV